MGGAGPASALARALELGEPGKRVLDWQCGLGGYGLWLAEKCGAKVWQVDERTALIEGAVQHSRTLPKAHTVLEVCRLHSREFDPESVDAVIVHTPQPLSPLSSSFYHRAAAWLRPGGRLVAGLLLGSVGEAEKLLAALAKAFGHEVVMTDMTPQMVEWMEQSLTASRAAHRAVEPGNGHTNGNAHVARKEQELQTAVEQWWEEQLERVKAGGLHYFLFKATKQA